MQGLRYTSRGLRRRNNTDKREVTLSHVDPATGETARTFHTVGAKTKKGAEKARDALIFGLGPDGGAVGSSMTVRELVEQFLRYKEASGTGEPSTARSYRASYLGHASVSMTLDIYADVDPDAKAAAVSKVEDSFDLDGYGPARIPDEGPGRPPKAPEPAISFTGGQLEAMLAAAEAKEAGREGA